jgi:hypothetical protein
MFIVALVTLTRVMQAMRLHLHESLLEGIVPTNKGTFWIRRFDVTDTTTWESNLDRYL